MPKTVEHLKRQAVAARKLALEKEAALVKVRAICEKYQFVAEDVYRTGQWPGDEPVDESVDEVIEELPQNVVRFTAGETYRNANGDVWTGRGRRPKWLVEALEQGASVEDFKVR